MTTSDSAWDINCRVGSHTNQAARSALSNRNDCNSVVSESGVEQRSLVGGWVCELRGALVGRDRVGAVERLHAGRDAHGDLLDVPLGVALDGWLGTEALGQDGQEMLRGDGVGVAGAQAALSKSVSGVVFGAQTERVLEEVSLVGDDGCVGGGASAVLGPLVLPEACIAG